MSWNFLTDKPKLPGDRAKVLVCDDERRVFACRAFYDGGDIIPKFYLASGHRVFGVVAWKLWPTGPRIPPNVRTFDDA